MCRNQVFFIFANNSRSKQTKKNPEHHFVDIVNEETCAKFQQNMFNSMVVRAHQSFQFFRQITGVLENRALSNFFLYGTYEVIALLNFALLN